MRKHKYGLLFTLGLLSIAFLAGCINYEQDVQLNENGSGTMIMHYSMAQQLVAMMSMGDQGGGEGEEGKDMPFKTKEEDIRKDLGVQGVRVEKVETKTEGDQSHFYVHIAFDSVANLNQAETFKKMPFNFKKEGDIVTFSQTLVSDKKEGEAESAPGDEMGKQMAAAMFGNAKFSFKVKLPSKALAAPDTNGKIAEDGQTVSWEYPLVDLTEGADKVMTAKFKAGGGGLPLMMLIGIGAAAIVSIAVILFVLSFMRKK